MSTMSSDFDVEWMPKRFFPSVDHRVLNGRRLQSHLWSFDQRTQAPAGGSAQFWLSTSNRESFRYNQFLFHDI